MNHAIKSGVVQRSEKVRKLKTAVQAPSVFVGTHLNWERAKMVRSRRVDFISPIQL